MPLWDTLRCFLALLPRLRAAAASRSRAPRQGDVDLKTLNGACVVKSVLVEEDAVPELKAASLTAVSATETNPGKFSYVTLDRDHPPRDWGTPREECLPSIHISCLIQFVLAFCTIALRNRTHPQIPLLSARSRAFCVMQLG